MLAQLRVTSAEVHTGSRLVRLAWGTWMIVRLFPPTAGWASPDRVAASAPAAPIMNARRCMGPPLVRRSSAPFAPSLYQAHAHRENTPAGRFRSEERRVGKEC